MNVYNLFSNSSEKGKLSVKEREEGKREIHQISIPFSSVSVGLGYGHLSKLQGSIQMERKGPWVRDRMSGRLSHLTDVLCVFPKETGSPFICHQGPGCIWERNSLESSHPTRDWTLMWWRASWHQKYPGRGWKSTQQGCEDGASLRPSGSWNSKILQGLSPLPHHNCSFFKFLPWSRESYQC